MFNLTADELLVPSSSNSVSEQDVDGYCELDVDFPMSEPPVSPRPDSPMQTEELEIDAMTVSGSPSRSTPGSSSKHPNAEEEEEEDGDGDEDEDGSQLDAPERPQSWSPLRPLPLHQPPSSRFSQEQFWSLPLINRAEVEGVVQRVTEEMSQTSERGFSRLRSPSFPMLTYNNPASQPPIALQTSVDMPTPQPSLLIPTPTSPALPMPAFSFESSESKLIEDPEGPVLLAVRRHHFDPAYTLPPSKFLPPECLRKSRVSKQRKRDKEKSETKCRDEWVPMGFTKWGALIRANPVYRKVSRATKCLSTRDWGVSPVRLKYAS